MVLDKREFLVHPNDPKGNEDKTEIVDTKTGAAKAIKDIGRAMRKQYSAEKILIVLGGLLGEQSIEELCCR